MKKRAIILSTFLSVSLLLTGCSWSDVKAKFTGEDTSGTTSAKNDYVASDCVTVPEYKGIAVDCKVTDEEVKDEIDSFLKQNATENKIKKGKCKKGQSVNIDYEGKLNGEAFDGGSATDQTITLGSSGFIDGFDDGVIGMKVGQSKDLNLKFPADYSQNKDLAGKDVVFTIKLNYISESVDAKLTDKLVSSKTDYKTVDEYKKGTLDELKKNKKDSAGQTAFSQVEEKAEVKTYPESLMNACSSQLDAYYKYQAKQYGFSDFNTFLTQSGMDENTYKDQLKKAAESITKSQLLAEAIAAKEGISVSDDEVTKEIANAATQAGQKEDDLKKNFKSLYGDAISIEDYYKMMLLSNKVVDLIGKNAKISE